ncbi:MAG: hypothetical protein RIE77_08675 [Phycisphaerales bacterium]|jgi:hypothetical protein
MDPRINAALYGGVVPGVIATLVLLLAGLLVALKRGPLPPPTAPPFKRWPMTPRGAVERGIVLVATLLVGAGAVLSMRLVESYDGWWPENVNLRTPALVAIGAIVAALVAAGPARWWFALPLCLLGGVAISYGIREPLWFTENLALDIALDAPAIGVSAFLVQVLLNRLANLDRGVVTRPVPVVVFAALLVTIPAIIFHFGVSVSSQQAGMVQAVLVSGAIALGLYAHSAGHVVVRGLGVLAAMAISVWMLLGRTVGSPLLTEWSVALLLIAALGCGVAALVVPRLKSWWTPALLVIVVVGAPLVAATLVQHAAFTKKESASEDYGY